MDEPVPPSPARRRLRLPATWNRWWRRLSPSRQDRMAALVPLLSVLLFMAAIVSAISYFTLEEIDREQESVTRDVEYAQQRLRLRLIERQEQLMRIARDLSNQDMDDAEFSFQAETLIGQYPELMSISWLDAQYRVKAAYASPSAPDRLNPEAGTAYPRQGRDEVLELAIELRQPVYDRPHTGPDSPPHLQLFIPLHRSTRLFGMLVIEYSIDGLLRFGVPPEVMARYAVALLDEERQLLAGTLHFGSRRLRRLPWSAGPQSHEIPVSPVGNSLILRAEGYRTSKDSMGDAFFWVVGALSLLTVWMLLANMRHSRRRLQVQRDLMAETNFRRAMENSMLTGMRALDMAGRISYVNPAFCSMTGWTEEELVGRTAPFPYWPEGEHDALMARLEDEMEGRSLPGGFEVPVKRKNGSVFYARMYVSPLISANGEQAGWMTSMTDISEPKRIREELTASYERFTTVLDSLDAAISVAPLGSAELLFANKMYQTWFGASGHGHRLMVDMASVLPTPPNGENSDLVDGLVGLPTHTLLEATADNTEVFVPELDKWLEMRTRYLTWVDGRLAQMVIATDITARRHAEEQSALQAQRAETASRLITMGEMASSVAHELNQPLTAISNYCSGMISRLQRQQIAPVDLLPALEKTSRQAQRAGQIIQRIRAFVKRSEPNPSLSDVGQMVANATELADIELRRHMVRLNTYVAARLPRLMVDPILIEQVLINLMKNAGESILHAQRPNGQRLVELCVTPKRIDGLAVIDFTVRDSGRGVPPEMLERIYEAFYSTKTEGMGIGLKLCRSIVESHHGRLQARNLYNGDEITGCEFSFWIPVVDPDNAAHSGDHRPAA